MPKRIKMTRQRPWRKDYPNAVIVARPSEWANPFRIGSEGIPDASTAVALFDAAITLKAHLDQTACNLGAILSDELGGIPSEKAIIRELQGKDLACWCSLDCPCHADVLLRIANQ